MGGSEASCLDSCHARLYEPDRGLLVAESSSIRHIKGCSLIQWCEEVLCGCRGDGLGEWGVKYDVKFRVFSGAGLTLSEPGQPVEQNPQKGYSLCTDKTFPAGLPESQVLPLALPCPNLYLCLARPSLFKSLNPEAYIYTVTTS